jgi:hypothetical protein
MITQEEEAVVSIGFLREKIRAFGSISGDDDRDAAAAFADLVLAWFAWELSLSQAQALRVFHFFGIRSPETVAVLKDLFLDWFSKLSR